MFVQVDAEDTVLHINRRKISWRCSQPRTRVGWSVINAPVSEEVGRPWNSRCWYTRRVLNLCLLHMMTPRRNYGEWRKSRRAPRYQNQLLRGTLPASLDVKNIHIHSACAWVINPSRSVDTFGASVFSPTCLGCKCWWVTNWRVESARRHTKEPRETAVLYAKTLIDSNAIENMVFHDMSAFTTSSSLHPGVPLHEAFPTAVAQTSHLNSYFCLSPLHILFLQAAAGFHISSVSYWSPFGSARQITLT